MVESKSASMWLILLVIPIALSSLLLIPGLGGHGEGLFPEILGAEKADTDEFADFAFTVRLWTATLLVLACLVGLGLWAWQRYRWTQRLRAFDARTVLRYRSFVLMNFLGACVVGAALGSAVFFSEVLRALPIVDWMVVGLACATVTALQFLCAQFGLTSSRRLYWGK